MPSSRQQNIRLGAFLVFGSLLSWIAYASLASTKVLEKGYTVEGIFKNIKQLKALDQVRLSGVRIGHVVETGLMRNKPFVKMFIKERYLISDDSVAVIKTAGFLGTSYVAVEPGPSRRGLRDGSLIRTMDLPEINDLLRETAAELKSILGQFGQFISQIDYDKEKGLSSLLFGEEATERTVAILKKLEDTTIKFNQFISQIDYDKEKGLSSLLFGEEAAERTLKVLEVLKEAIFHFSTFGQDLESFGKQALGKSDNLVWRLFYDKNLAKDGTQLVGEAREFVDKLNKPNNFVGRLLNSDELYQDIRKAIIKVDRAASGFSESSPLSALGILANALF